MVIIMAEIKNVTNTVRKSTDINDNYITLTERKLTLFTNNAVLINIKLKIVLIIIL